MGFWQMRELSEPNQVSPSTPPGDAQSYNCARRTLLERDPLLGSFPSRLQRNIDVLCRDAVHAEKPVVSLVPLHAWPLLSCLCSRCLAWIMFALQSITFVHVASRISLYFYNSISSWAPVQKTNRGEQSRIPSLEYFKTKIYFIARLRRNRWISCTNNIAPSGNYKSYQRRYAEIGACS